MKILDGDRLFIMTISEETKADGFIVKGRDGSHRGIQMLICVHGMDDGAPYGDIRYPGMREPEKFHGLGDMISRIDAIGEELGVPSGTDDGVEEVPRRMPEKLEFPLSSYPLGRPRKTFYLELLARQGQSLQGRIRGVKQEPEEIYFRSALELMGRIRSNLE